MSIDPGSVEHLSEVISHVVAPAFLLGAVASFASILMTRMNSVLERLRLLNDLPPSGHAKSAIRSDIPRLKRRLILLHRSFMLSIASGAFAAILILVAFGAALLQISHVWSAAILFMISMAFLLASLLMMAREVMIGLSEHDFS
jgi:heme exporter protein D